jgi:hypothetical protein
MRVVLVGCIVIAVGFAAGVTLRLVGDASEAVAPESAKAIDGGAVLREVRLLRVDPGALPRPAPTPADAPASPVRGSVVVGPIRPPAPAPRAPTAPAPTEPSPAADGGGGFESPGPDEAPQENTFDSEG